MKRLNIIYTHLCSYTYIYFFVVFVCECVKFGRQKALLKINYLRMTFAIIFICFDLYHYVGMKDLIDDSFSMSETTDF